MCKNLVIEIMNIHLEHFQLYFVIPHLQCSSAICYNICDLSFSQMASYIKLYIVFSPKL